MRGSILLVFLFVFFAATKSTNAGHHQKRQAQQQQLLRYNYDEALAKRLVLLAAGAYADNSTTRQQCVNKANLAGDQMRVLTANARTCDILANTCSFYTTRSDARRELVIVFRGTKSKGQLFLEGWQSTQPGHAFYNIGKVHGYFYNGLNVLWQHVQAILSDPQIAGYKVIFTGHSLGGALASLASVRAVLDKMLNSDQVVLYTYGQPRVGCAKFAKAHDQLVPNSFRVVNSRDIVPHLPPCSKEGMPALRNSDGHETRACNPTEGNKAYHHGTEVWYAQGMGPGASFHVCVGEPHGEDMGCSDQLAFDPDKYKLYVWDHRNYFGERVPRYGKVGCEPNYPGRGQQKPTDDENGDDFATAKFVGPNQAAPNGAGSYGGNGANPISSGLNSLVRGAKKLIVSLLNR